MTRRRLHEHNHHRWHADRARAIGGDDLVGLVSAGKVYPMALAELEASARELAPAVSVARVAQLVALARIVAAIAEGMHRPVVIWSHAHVASLLGVSRRLAGEIVRLAVEVGLLEQRPHFVRRSDGGELSAPELDERTKRPLALEAMPSYAPGPRLRDCLRARSRRLMMRTRSTLAAASRQVGNGCQPSIQGSQSPDPDNRCPDSGTSRARSITGPSSSGGSVARNEDDFLTARAGRSLELLSMPADPQHRAHRRAVLRSLGVAMEDTQLELDELIAKATATGLKTGALS